jgi:hypothetical protein
VVLPVTKETGCETYLKSENNVIPEYRVILHKTEIIRGVQGFCFEILELGSHLLSETKSGINKYRC